MGLKDKNNPLGQHVPSDKVGATGNPGMQHDQSAELVEGIRKRAKKGQNDNIGREPLNTPEPLQSKTPLAPDANAYREEPADPDQKTPPPAAKRNQSKP